MATALTVLQPWAFSIIHGPKTIENRSWKTHYRGRLFIHVGKSRSWLERAAALNWPKTFGVPFPSDDELAYGAIIGHVELVDCVPVEQVQDDPWAFGPYCWVLRDPVAIEPIPCPGRQMLWNLSDELLTANVT